MDLKWGLDHTTPGMIAASAILARWALSPDECLKEKGVESDRHKLMTGVMAALNDDNDKIKPGDQEMISERGFEAGGGLEGGNSNEEKNNINEHYQITSIIMIKQSVCVYEVIDGLDNNKSKCKFKKLSMSKTMGDKMDKEKGSYTAV
ncbi:hypothetical protein SERLADRAFT_404574 [Serpula lacrymans var. lacrymans S7.9]|nr:uncharacterized protein SERLADRAFT_404574 [Serpula lacrymans var. lacrymans S7.9]EGO30376.1 hypothetical protein SERLADRAFT_404574 [Serpula lacrymans var. lacrymans S7.9]